MLKRRLCNALLLAAGVLLPGCGTIGDIAGTNRVAQGQSGYVRGFLGGVVSEEPRAALVAREVLSAGGSATDAAVALGFALSVSLPSRASLGGGGVCVTWNSARAELLGFAFPARTAGGGNMADDRPAAVPMLARGLFALHARGGGRLNFERLVSPAEAMARFGILTSRTLARDLSPVAALLARDPSAAAVFVPGGRPLAEGDQMTQPELANTLGTIRGQGPGDLYQGALGRRIADASAAAGGTLTIEELRAAVPQMTRVAGVRAGNDLAFAAPDPAGAAAIEAWRTGQPAGADRPGGLRRLDRLPGVRPRRQCGGLFLDHEQPVRHRPHGARHRPAAGRGADRARRAAAAAGGDRGERAGEGGALRRRCLGRGCGAGGAGRGDAVRDQQQPAGGGCGGGPRTAFAQGEGRVSVLTCPRYFRANFDACGWAADPRGSGLATGGE